jgi:hypothetical protein
LAWLFSAAYSSGSQSYSEDENTSHSVIFALVFVLAGQVLGQTPKREAPSPNDAAASRWEFSLATSGYLVPDDQSYGSPIFTADHQWLHLEARYNEEYLQTGSLWAGYTFIVGHKLVFEATPMFGVVCGSTTGVAPGYELSLTYKRVELSAQGEYVFNTDDRKVSYFYTWDELVYSPTDWFHAGLVAQRTREYRTNLDVQRGFSVGVAHKKMDFTTYIFNAGWTDPTAVLAVTFRF